jgi:hypothetical protein
MITVKDLIEYLQKLPQDALLVYPEIECLDREYWVAKKIDHEEREGSDYELDPRPYSSKRIKRKGIYIMLDM